MTLFRTFGFLLFGVATAVAQETPKTRATLTGSVVAASDGQRLAARLYLSSATGTWYFVQAATPEGKAVPYDKTNWLNNQAFEKHTALSAHPFRVDLPTGKYALLVERGKEYFPEMTIITVGAEPLEVTVKLRRWCDMAARGWYSGETHIHRTLDELPTVMLAEDLNVALPLTYWVTHAFTAPTAGDKNLGGKIPDTLITVDPTHVIWPRNTEYEIFTVGKQRHTLGAIFMLNHRSVLNRGLPPVQPIAEQAANEGALFDIDKADWPFAMTLLTSAKPTLYELSNNHVWRTQFAFNDWNSATPGYLQPPFGGKKGNERDWLHYTLGMYYTLLDAGFRMVPTAGTANGVHPVPAGFGRVYVHLDGAFSYDKWLAGLRAGRSFVTTGPMLQTTVNDQPAGSTLKLDGATKVVVRGNVQSEHPLAYIELVRNGEVVRTVMPQNKPLPTGAHETSFIFDDLPTTSGWLAVRCFEDRPDGRFRFAHTAPWWVTILGKPLRMRVEEQAYLVKRVRDEIERSRGVLPEEALAEYQTALKTFQQLTTQTTTPTANRRIDPSALRGWLENMIWYHRYTLAEVVSATGIPERDLVPLIREWRLEPATKPVRPADASLLALPYPGGRHPRTGFRDGAIEPQRETKLSVFAPWADGGYAVVDVPEAIWSNLGLTYLAHTHVPTIWEKAKVTLPPLEWTKNPDGSYTTERRLPNGIAFKTHAIPQRDHVQFELRITNGTKDKLTNLRAQVCVMLQALPGMHAQTGTNKVTAGNIVACRDDTGSRWLVTAWEPVHRAWNNPPVPCLHADPSFPDCAPGATVAARGIVLFHEGKDSKPAFERVTALLK